MVKIKKNSITILYISAIYIGGSLLLSSLYFMLDHQTVTGKGLSWLFWVVPTILVATYIMTNLFYNLCGKTYYEFREKEIALIKKGHAEKIIKHDTIVKLVYEKCSIHILAGGGRLGELMVVYEENNEICRHGIEIPFHTLKRTYLYKNYEIIIGNI